MTRPQTTADVRAPIRAFLSRSFDGETFADADDVFALGFGNSLFAMQLVTFVEEEFGIEVEAEDLDMSNFNTIDSIANLVQRKLGQA